MRIQFTLGAGPGDKTIIEHLSRFPSGKGCQHLTFEIRRLLLIAISRHNEPGFEEVSEVKKQANIPSRFSTNEIDDTSVKEKSPSPPTEFIAQESVDPQDTLGLMDALDSLNQQAGLNI